MIKPFQVKNIKFVIVTTIIILGLSVSKLSTAINPVVRYNSGIGITKKGKIINWSSNTKLKQTDFRAKRKKVKGMAVATTASAFGYSITDNNGVITGSIYVQFHCNDSWWNPEYKNDDNRGEILKHEQLHFDICELYGRKLYKEIITLKKAGKLNEYNLNKVHGKIEKEYTRFQDRYDDETGHSINKKEQAKWNNRIQNELNSYSKFSNYESF